MIKKIVLLLFIFLISILFSGCDYSSSIDKASIVQMITVEKSDDKSNQKFNYTFFLLNGSDKNSKVSINANSLNQACALAQKKYIPNVTLSKFELFVVNENLYKDILKKDLYYMSSQYSISPCVYVTLCTDGYLEFLSEADDAVKQTESSIMLLKNNISDSNINSLSIFNSINSTDCGTICMSCINSNKEVNEKYIDFLIIK